MSQTEEMFNKIWNIHIIKECVCVCVCMCTQSLSCAQPFETPWTAARQAPLPMGILQARILEWVAMPSSRGSSQPWDKTQVSCIVGRLFIVWATREDQEYWEHWSGYPIPSPGDHPNPGIKAGSTAWWQILNWLSYQGSLMVIIKLFSSISFIVNITMNIPSCKSFMKFFLYMLSSDTYW